MRAVDWTECGCSRCSDVRAEASPSLLHQVVVRLQEIGRRVRRVAKRQMHARRLWRRRAGRGLASVPIFLLVRQVKLTKRLDLAKAAEVALALAEYFDIPPENMVIQGYGEAELLIDTEANERRNRRVAVRVITPLLHASAN